MAAQFLGARCKDAGPDDAGDVIAERIIGLMKMSGRPNGLTGIGFSAADIDSLAQAAIRQGRAIANAPRSTQLEDLQNIYAQSLQYW